MDKHNLSIVLPCAGLGIRLRSNRPKLLSQFDDGEFLYEKQLKCIKEVFPHNEIIYVLGFQADKLKKKLSKENNVKVIINHDFEDTNAAYSIGLGLSHSKHNNSLIIYGDLFFNTKLLETVAQSGHSSFIVTNRSTMDNDEVGYLALGNKVTRMNYGFPILWSQIMYLRFTEQQRFIKASQEMYAKNALGFEVLNAMIGCGSQFDIVEPDNKCYVTDIDNSKDMDKVNNLIRYADFL